MSKLKALKQHASSGKAKVSFSLVGDNLYKLSASGILMKCVTLEEGKDILREIHEGVCGNHAASRILVDKAYRSGFFWPIVVSDAEDLVRRCPGCQFFGRPISQHKT